MYDTVSNTAATQTCLLILIKDTNKQCCSIMVRKKLVGITREGLNDVFVILTLNFSSKNFLSKIPKYFLEKY